MKSTVAAVALASAFGAIAQALPSATPADFMTHLNNSAGRYVTRTGGALNSTQLARIASFANSNTVGATAGRTGLAILRPFMVGVSVPVAAGVILLAAAAAGAYLIWRHQRDSTTSNRHAVQTTETAVNSSNWSLSGHPNWTRWKQQFTGSVYKVWWLFNPPAGKTQDDFDPAVHVDPDLYPVSEAAAAQTLAEATGLLNPAWTQQVLQNIVTGAAGAAGAAGEPLPAPFFAPLIPPVTLLDVTPSVESAVAAAGLSQLWPSPSGDIASPAAPFNAAGATWPSGAGAGGEGGEGGETGSGPDWSVPALPDFPQVNPLDWWPDPFTAPTLNATCVDFAIPLGEFGIAQLPVCSMIDIAAPIIGPVVATSAIITASHVILDS
ncbi:hypothetical protein L6Q21_13095 [Sandaracinobacter sp. RS1-74]|uniref:hypothetical protein n=1 Tax=Sandaracinobacteroides sayramensis TaxID=2913411 RepID=UPI001EDB90E6|nr:hypothetical protein [Sandaracinobacteroides sayramensis]MCG2841919.1 hypothetical protein [Sandaracinobacteroides sayramensis]